MLTQALDVGFGPRLRARRLRQLIVTAASTALMLTWSAGPAAALYYDFCSPNFAAIHKTWTINTEVSPSYNISGSLANVRVRSISPCTQNGIVADQSFVPVTLQYDGTEANKDKIVQIGYSKCGASGGCNDIPSDLKPHFWYTKSDTGSGLAWLADGWYKAPVIGDENRMKVEAISSGGSKWQYCIRDVTRGEAYTCHLETRTWSAGTFAWWGTETTNTNSQNGTVSAGPHLNLRAQYKLSGIWYYRSGSTNVCSKLVPPGYLYPNYYNCSIANLVDTNGNGQLDDQESLLSYTTDH